jgi:hypothetical protein
VTPPPSGNSPTWAAPTSTAAPEDIIASGALADVLRVSFIGWWVVSRVHRADPSDAARPADSLWAPNLSSCACGPSACARSSRVYKAALQWSSEFRRVDASAALDTHGGFRSRERVEAVVWTGDRGVFLGFVEVGGSRLDFGEVGGCVVCGAVSPVSCGVDDLAKRYATRRETKARPFADRSETGAPDARGRSPTTQERRRMRITTPPRRRHAGTVIVVAAAIILSLLLVIAGTVGGNSAEHGDDSSAITRVKVTTQDTGPEGPRAAGELVDEDARPITVADAYHGVGIMVCPTGTRLVEVADAYHGVGLGVCV